MKSILLLIVFIFLNQTAYPTEVSCEFSWVNLNTGVSFKPSNVIIGKDTGEMPAGFEVGIYDCEIEVIESDLQSYIYIGEIGDSAYAEVNNVYFYHGLDKKSLNATYLKFFPFYIPISTFTDKSGNFKVKIIFKDVFIGKTGIRGGAPEIIKLNELFYKFLKFTSLSFHALLTLLFFVFALLIFLYLDIDRRIKILLVLFFILYGLCSFSISMLPRYFLSFHLARYLNAVINCFTYTGFYYVVIKQYKFNFNFLWTFPVYLLVYSFGYSANDDFSFFYVNYFITWFLFLNLVFALILGARESLVLKSYDKRVVNFAIFVMFVTYLIDGYNFNFNRYRYDYLTVFTTFTLQPLLLYFLFYKLKVWMRTQEKLLSKLKEDIISKINNNFYSDLDSLREDLWHEKINLYGNANVEAGVNFSKYENKILLKWAVLNKELFDYYMLNQEVSELRLNSPKQLAHDLMSPLLVAETVLENQNEISENDKMLLLRSLIRIRNIAKSSIPGYNKKSSLVVREVIEEVLSEKKLLFNSLKLNMKVNYNLEIEFERYDFERIVSNILNNSYEALMSSDSGKTLKIDIIIDKETIEIVDNGPGIPCDYINKINNGEKVSSKRIGSGLGLFHAKNKLKKEGGDLIVTSSSKGATIKLVFNSL